MIFLVIIMCYIPSCALVLLFTFMMRLNSLRLLTHAILSTRVCRLAAFIHGLCELCEFILNKNDRVSECMLLQGKNKAEQGVS